MLSVINQEPRGHGNLKTSDTRATISNRGRLEFDLPVNRDGDGGKDVSLGVLDDVSRDLRNPGTINRSLRAELGLNFLLVKNE